MLGMGWLGHLKDVKNWTISFRQIIRSQKSQGSSPTISRAKSTNCCVDSFDFVREATQFFHKERCKFSWWIWAAQRCDLRRKHVSTLARNYRKLAQLTENVDFVMYNPHLWELNDSFSCRLWTMKGVSWKNQNIFSWVWLQFLLKVFQSTFEGWGP